MLSVGDILFKNPRESPGACKNNKKLNKIGGYKINIKQLVFQFLIANIFQKMESYISFIIAKNKTTNFKNKYLRYMKKKLQNAVKRKTVLPLLLEDL